LETSSIRLVRGIYWHIGPDQISIIIRGIHMLCLLQAGFCAFSLRTGEKNNFLQGDMLRPHVEQKVHTKYCGNLVQHTVRKSKRSSVLCAGVPEFGSENLKSSAAQCIACASHGGLASETQWSKCAEATQYF